MKEIGKLATSAIAVIAGLVFTAYAEKEVKKEATEIMNNIELKKCQDDIKRDI